MSHTTTTGTSRPALHFGSGSGTFRERIDAALADGQLQSALDGNAERRQSAFTGAFASLPEGRQVLRERAHAIRGQVIADLDRYVAQFASNAAANGILIRRAANAQEAVEIVKQIAREAGARLITKSKTMVGEEIHLNEHLEAEGLRVVETDLGEYIVQLRGEPPAHIITPAVHLTRAQVAQTFEEKIGLPFTTDIPALTAAARRVLRQTFLEADIGVSGVNFGVAETGTLTLVTNEGNGRMCTTLPDIHIALMGIERLVPTLDDLAVMLNLLPRSATGQKLSVYTSLIHSPRRPGETDGPRQRYLILLDNGRRAMRETPLEEALYCIRCGACLNACPIFREIGGHAYVGVDGKLTTYPGPIGSVVSPGLFGVANFGNLARASSLCGACKDACPIDIDLPKLLLWVRAEGANIPARSSQPNGANKRDLVPSGLRLGLKGFSIFARSTGLFRVAQRLGGIFSKLVPGAEGWMRLPAFTGWGYGRDFPRLAARPFSASKLARELSPLKMDGEAGQLAKKAPVGHAVSAAPIVTSNPAAHTVSGDLAERFANELHELGGEIIRCRASELAGRIGQLIRASDVNLIQAWNAEFLPAGLLDALAEQGVCVTHTADPEVHLGLTGALAGIAETGSLVLAGGPGRPPTASLLPEIHVAVLWVADLQERLVQALRLPEIRQASSLSIITGPSRTADIEMTLTIGVHGPGRLIVFLTEAS